MRAFLGLLALLGTAGSVHAQCLTDRLHAPAGGAPTELFPWSLALEGDFLAIGAPADFSSAVDGRVLVYERNATGGFDPLAVLQHPQGSAFFGSGVAFSQGRLAVGDTITGKFFFYEQQGGTWTALAETAPVTSLTNLFYERPYIGGANPHYSFDGIYYNGRLDVYSEAPGGHALHLWALGGPDEMLGHGLAFADGYLAIGSPGFGSLGEFEEPSHVTVWSFPDPSTPPSQLTTIDDPLGGNDTRFGRAIAMTAERLVVGAGDSSLQRLETYRFVAQSVTWEHTGQILPPASGSFSGPLALDGTTLIAGGQTAFGATTAFRYEWSGSAWSLAGELPLLGATGSEPTSVVVDGSAVAVGVTSDAAAWTFDLAGACPGLVATPATVSLATGGKQDWLASFSPSAAGAIYWIVGSASGTAPGIPLGALTLPLVPDAWLATTIADANQPPFQASLGVLGAQGTAIAALHVPAGLDPALAGLVLHHAAAVIDVGTGAVTAVSAAAELELVP